MGADVTYYLAQNPDIAESLATKSMLQVNREIARIEERLQNMQKSVSQKPVVKTTTAPPPIAPVGKSTTSFIDGYREDMTIKEYEAWRRSSRSK
jgi:hypothetical protein